MAIAVGIVALAVAFAWWDDEAGFRSRHRLEADLALANGRIEATEARIAAHEAEAGALRSDKLAQERAIRKDLRLARPGETIVQLSGSEEPTLRNP